MPGKPPWNRGRGIALIIVLWMVALLSVIALGLGFAMRTEVALATHLTTSAKAYALAEAGVYRTLLVLLKSGTTSDTPKDGSEQVWHFAGGEVSIALQDESGRIDLNAASPELLAGMFASVEVPEEDRQALVDAIVDWRDEDDVRSPEGAEDSDYDHAGLDYGPRNKDFVNVDELGEVLGMTPAVLNKVKPLLTVFLHQPGINPTFASREVLLAIPGADAAEVEAYLTQRDQANTEGAPAPPPPVSLGQFLSLGMGRVYRIAASARPAAGGRARIEVVVGLQPNGTQPYTLYTWRDGRLDPSEEPQAEPTPANRGSDNAEPAATGS